MQHNTTGSRTHYQRNSYSHASSPPDSLPATQQILPGAAVHVSPFDIVPVPTIKKKVTNRGRKAAGSCVITAKTYKEALSVSLEKSATNKGKKRLMFEDNHGQRKKKDARPKKPVTGSGTKPESEASTSGKASTSRKRHPKRDQLSSESKDDNSLLDPPLDDSDSDLEIPQGEYPGNEDASCVFRERLLSEDSKGEI